MLTERIVSVDGHVYRCIVQALGDGWEVREEQDGRVVTRVIRRWWQRVECDLMLFEHRHGLGHPFGRAAGDPRASDRP